TSSMKPYVKAHTLTGGHSDSINCLAFSPCGLYLASGSDDHALIIWRVSDGSHLYSLSFGGAVNALLWHPSQEGVIICGCQDGLVFRAKDFNLTQFSGRRVKLDFQGPVHCLDFDKSTNRLAVGIGCAVCASTEKSNGEYDGWVEFPDPNDPASSNSIADDSSIRPRTVHFYDHGRLLIVTYLSHGVIAWDVDKVVQLWCIRPPSEAPQLWTHPVLRGSSSLCAQMDMLVVHNLYAGVHMYRLGRQKVVRAFTCEPKLLRRHILSVSFIHNGDAVVTGAEAGDVRIWQAQCGNLFQVLEHGDDLIQAVAAFQNSSRYIATGSALKGPQTYIKIWRAPAGACHFCQTSTQIDRLLKIQRRLCNPGPSQAK
ncbi:WD40-repeat-containing domain protein, partial [Hygrophoropsis aurantiaca]